MYRPVKKVLAIAGGVGGAKLAVGLQEILGKNLSIVVNTGDDFEWYGLKICPDIDSVSYALAGLNDPERGWGVKNETWKVHETLGGLKSPNWFRMGDRDLATQLERIRLLKSGLSLTEVTEDICQRLGVLARVLPMSDHACPTMVNTREFGWLSFQEYFVREGCLPRVTKIEYQHPEGSSTSSTVVEALEEADLVVVCPSNPWLSIGPILSLGGIRPLLETKPVIVVSPFVAGKTIKGPAGKIAAELNLGTNQLTILDFYAGLVNALIYDKTDPELIKDLPKTGIILRQLQTIMHKHQDKVALAHEVLNLGVELIN
jgi:LPPG:FO 2-phospho-L-lactate transferase